MYLVDHGYLQEVVPRAQCTQLRCTPLLGLVTHLRRVSTRHLALFFGSLQVLRSAIPFLHRPARPPGQDFVDFPTTQPNLAFRAKPGGDVFVKGVHQLLYPGTDLFLCQIGA